MTSLQEQRRRELTTAVLPAVCSMLVPGSGQLMTERRENGIVVNRGIKALRLFCVAAGLVVGLVITIALNAPAPFRAVFAVALLATHGYAAFDAFTQGRNRVS
ncbi:MAG: hypothetical protein H0T42_07050 [Deltaproteobacteria bacterium]|nr:hypothetical protein [Deltaproteobacteria bacterium]